MPRLATAEEKKKLIAGPRLASPDELSRLQPINVHQKQGVSWFERMAVQVLANDPEKAKFWLRHRGYDVQEFGKPGDFNFAVRKDASQPWKVVDPEGIDMGGFLSELLPEFAAGALTEMGRAAAGVAGTALGFAGGSPSGPGAIGTAAAGGLAGEMLGAGASGAATDAMLQELGVLIGVNQQIDPVQSALVGGMSALVPAGFAGVRRVARSGPAKAAAAGAARRIKPALGWIGEKSTKAVGEVSEILAKFAGFPEDFSQNARQSLLRTARRLPDNAPSALDAVDITRNVLDSIAGKKFTETRAAERLLRRQSKKAMVEITDEIDALTRLIPSEVAATADGQMALSKLQREILNEVNIPIRGEASRMAGGEARNLLTGEALTTPTKKISNIVTGALEQKAVRTQPARIAVRNGILSRNPVTNELNPVLVDVEKALSLKRKFADIAEDANIFKRTVKKTGKRYEKRVASASATINEKLRANLGSSSLPVYDTLMKGAERKMAALKGMERLIGRSGRSEASRISLEAGEKLAPENVFLSLLGKGSQSKLRAIQTFDKVFKKDIERLMRRAGGETPAKRLVARGVTKPTIEDIAREAFTGTPFGGGKPGFIPPLGATGAVKSAAAFGSLVPQGLLTGAGGALGGVPGSLIGFSLASPRILANVARLVIGETKVTNWTAKNARQVAEWLIKKSGNPALSKAERAAIFALVQEKMRQISQNSRETVQ